MGFPLPVGRFMLWGNDGKPLAGGLVETYQAGTNIPLTTYADADLTVPNENPVELDLYGRAAIYVPDGTPIKIIVKDSAGVTLYTEPEVMVPQIAVPPAAAGFLPGMGMAWFAAAAPAGWLLCDGSAVSRATYAALFAVIGTTYGNGNGSTTFNLPDRRGRFGLGKAAAGTGSVLGSSGGTLDHNHSVPAHAHVIPPHTHTVPAHQHSIPRNGWATAENIPPLAGVLQAGGSGIGSESAATQVTADGLTGPSTAQVTTQQAAGNTGDSAVLTSGNANPAYLVVNYIIKT